MKIAKKLEIEGLMDHSLDDQKKEEPLAFLNQNELQIKDEIVPYQDQPHISMKPSLLMVR